MPTRRVAGASAARAEACDGPPGAVPARVTGQGTRAVRDARPSAVGQSEAKTAADSVPPTSMPAPARISGLHNQCPRRAAACGPAACSGLFAALSPTAVMCPLGVHGTTMPDIDRVCPQKPEEDADHREAGPSGRSLTAALGEAPSPRVPLLGRDLRVQRQGENLAGGRLGDGEVAGAVAEVTERGLRWTGTG